jgi:acyl-CoA thioesterase II
VREPKTADNSSESSAESPLTARDLTEPAAESFSAPVGDVAEEKRRQLIRAERLLEILALERIEENLYRGSNEVRGEFRLFGGQVLAQALRAASNTVDGCQVHSLHAYFMRAGNAQRPVLYEVDRIRDGRSFTTRRIVAIQEGRAIFSMSASFQIEESGFEHTHSMPNVPPPEELEDDLDVVSNLKVRSGGLSPMAGRARPFEMRSVFPLGSPQWQQHRFWNPVWIRFPIDISAQAEPAATQAEPAATQAEPAATQALARCLLAYASDMGLVSTALLPHGAEVPRSKVQMASLDHALWVHREIPLDEWLLFHKRTSTAAGARGLTHADFFSRDGVLLASVTQEGLVRTMEG